MKEPGKTGSLWRIHYSLRWPDWKCDFFKLTAVEGKGTGESLQQFPLRAGDHVLADRGYCHVFGIHYATTRQAWLTVRSTRTASCFTIRLGLPLRSWPSSKRCSRPGPRPLACLGPISGSGARAARLCVIRKSKAAIALAHKKLRRKASKQGSQLQPETLVYAEYVMVLTTLPEAEFPATLICSSIVSGGKSNWYLSVSSRSLNWGTCRARSRSAKAWLYGKLFVALLTEKLIQQARALSPLGV